MHGVCSWDWFGKARLSQSREYINALIVCIPKSEMKKYTLLALLLASTMVYAQSSPAKKDLVAKILVLQQPAIEQTAQALVERPAMQLHQQAGLALQSRVAPEKREAAAKLVQEDLKKYVDEVGPQVRQQAVKLAPSTIGALLEEKFTEDELKQLIAIIE